MKRNPPADLQPDFYRSIAEVLRAARTKANRAVNFAMVEAYWHIGRMIVEEEQQGRERADYGTALIRSLSVRLTEEFGKGFDERELRRIRQFYLSFSIRDALRPELAWTHYRLLIRVEKTAARTWYMREAADQNWSTRALQRQINSLYYELKCFVLVDLKTGELTHQDIGQIDRQRETTVRERPAVYVCVPDGATA